jgi:uncharacterized membrane protein
MSVSFWLKLYLLTIPVFFVIDMIWLGYVAKSFYAEQLHSLLSPQVNWIAAFCFYAIYIAGILFFAVHPGLEAASLGKACFYGALFGLVTYATYDLTNLATLRDWPLLVSVVDIAWGTFLCTLVAGGSYLIGSWLR